jgi:hypothetical protein
MKGNAFTYCHYVVPTISFIEPTCSPIFRKVGRKSYVAIWKKDKKIRSMVFIKLLWILNVCFQILGEVIMF